MALYSHTRKREQEVFDLTFSSLFYTVFIFSGCSMWSICLSHINLFPTIIPARDLFFESTKSKWSIDIWAKFGGDFYFFTISRIGFKCLISTFWNNGANTWKEMWCSLIKYLKLSFENCLLTSTTNCQITKNSNIYLRLFLLEASASSWSIHTACASKTCETYDLNKLNQSWRPPKEKRGSGNRS